MKRAVPALFFVALTLVLNCLVGCATQLDPSGAYQGDRVLYSADQTVNAAYTALDTFESWELANHGYLVIHAPQVVQASENVRTNAPNWFQRYGSVKAIYIAARGTAQTNLFSLAQSNLVYQANFIGGQATNVTALVKTTPTK